MSTVRLSLRRAVTAEYRTFRVDAQRQKSTNANARAYLDAWVGLPQGSVSTTAASRNNNPILKARMAMSQAPLFVTGTSYLLPTLRLERNTNPQSLKERLQQSSSNAGSCDIDTGEAFPIVLDLSAFKPDGSHHYQAPPSGILKEFLTALHYHNFTVMGICGPLPETLAQEASTIGIPCLWTPSRATADPKFDVSQLLQMVQRREQQKVAGRIPSLEAEQTLSEDHGIMTQDERTVGDGKNVDGKGEQNIEESNLNITTIDAEGNNGNQDEDDTAFQILNPIEKSSGSTLYHGSVRSGQQIMSERGQSLVILGSVSSGGEVLSDGDIFIFGKLRGRALAGLGASEAQTGDGPTTCPARIVATSFDPELVGIGDLFTTVDRVEDMNPNIALRAGQPIMVTMTKSKDELMTRSLEFLPVRM